MLFMARSERDTGLLFSDPANPKAAWVGVRMAQLGTLLYSTIYIYICIYMYPFLQEVACIVQYSFILFHKKYAEI